MQPWVGILVIGILIILWLQIANFNLLLSPQRTPAEPRTRSEFYFVIFLGVQMSGITKLVEYVKRGSRQLLRGVLAAVAVYVAMLAVIALLALFDTAASNTALLLCLFFIIELLIAAIANMHYSNARGIGTA